MTSSAGFRIAAVILLIAGAGLVVFGATADVTVQPDSRYVPYVGLVEAPRTVNFQLMLRAVILVLVGGFAFVSGCVLLVGAAIPMKISAVAPVAAGGPVDLEDPLVRGPPEPQILGQSPWRALAVFGGLIAATAVGLLVFVR